MRTPRTTLVACAALWAACLHNTRDLRRDAAHIVVSGKAYLCGGQEYSFSQVAAGKTIRLVTDEGVLAEDVVALDGSFVLSPKAPQTVTGPIYLEAGDRRIALANDYASWLQNEVTYKAKVQFGCGPAESDRVVARPAFPARGIDAGTPAERSDGRVPSSRLLPKN